MKTRLFIKEGSKVPYKKVILGYNRNKLPVQIYVLSNDGLYYLQSPPKPMRNHKFSIECVFGLTPEEPPIESGYEIIAVHSTDRPHSPVKELPQGVFSRKRVWRNL